MRTIKDLLILLREELVNDFDHCICWQLASMVNDWKISHLEYDEIIIYLEERRPDKKKGKGSFWWPYGELQPRLEFLDKLIAEL